LASSSAAEREKLRIDGSASMTAINQMLKQRYEKQFPTVDLTIQTSGVEPALKALLNGEIDLAAVGRSLTAAEKAQGLREIPLSRDQIAIVVGQANPFAGSLTLEQLGQIFRGEITDWAEVGGAAAPIRLIDRPADSDTRLALQQYRGFGDAFTAQNVIQLETDDTAAMLDKLGEDGIGYAIASQLAGQDKAKPVRLTITQTVLPQDALYPYAQPRGYAYRELDNAAQAFLGFATTKPGQAAVAAAKLEEAKAIAAGELIVLKPQPEVMPISQAPEVSTPSAPSEPESRSFWWLLLLLGFPLVWLLRRVRRSPVPKVPAAEIPTAPVSPVPTEATPEATPVAQATAEPVSTVVATEEMEEAVIVPTVVFQPVASEPIVSEPTAIDTDQANIAEANTGEAEMTSEQIEADLGLVEAKAVPAAELDKRDESDLEPLQVVAIAEVTVVETPVEISVEVESPESEPASQSESLKQALVKALSEQGKTPKTATLLDCYSSLSALICRHLLALSSAETAPAHQKIVGEIAAEYLPGPHLENSLLNLGLLEAAQSAVADLGYDWPALLDQEEEPGLGKGGLGRLMVCYLDAMATLEVPAIGYGLRYEYGIFDQEIHDGWQVEVVDSWLRSGNPWEIERPDLAVTVGFGGSSIAYIDEQNRYRLRWLPAELVQGIPYDSPIPGYQRDKISLMRLWRAESGDLCKVLYPVDVELKGKALRLKQQFFLASCALQDALRLHLAASCTAETLPSRFALQLNDTDPSLAVVELMRLLVDEQGLDWDSAWRVTEQTFAYSNHSLMPETLDDLWSVSLFEQLLPRHLELIYEINARLLESVAAKYPNNPAKLSQMSLIDERGERYIRLNFLACIGSHAVNGVSPLHTDLLKQTVLRDFYELAPEKFSSQTNGITPRRFLLQTNPPLASLISSKLGEGWITDLSQLSGLEAYASDPLFCAEWLRVKQAAKQSLAAQILRQTGIEINPNSLFDLQAMVIHEYKRQHLNLLHILTLYQRLKANPTLDITPRSFIFAGKAAPDYFTAKLIIRLIHAVADLVNPDPDLRGRLKVVFLPDFNIKTAQPLYPAADLSEHLSLAGTEAADTGNLIAVLNGALMLGTADGTNLEIRAAVGAENCFEFGLSLAEAQRLRATGYNPMLSYDANPELHSVLDLLTSDLLSNGDPELFRPLVNLLIYYDQYLLLADYADYIATQEQVSQAYRDTERWTRMSILSTARLGFCSAERAVRGYCQEIWQIPVEPAQLEPVQPKKHQPKKRLG
jgi:starch phosphorylase